MIVRGDLFYTLVEQARPDGFWPLGPGTTAKIVHANRHHARDAQQTLELLQTAHVIEYRQLGTPARR